MTPESESDRLFPHLLAQCRQMAGAHGPPESIPLTIYPTDADRQCLIPGDPWSAGFHRAVTSLLVERLQAQGYPAVLREITREAYLSWLDAQGLINSTQNRARYISHATPP